MTRTILAAVLVCGLAPWAVARAADDGQADLDKATELTVSVETLADLERIVELCQSALKKGLDKENAEFAKQLLTSNLYQHAERISASIFRRGVPNNRWPVLRKLAVADLEKLFSYDNQMGAAYLLHARLQALPRGDKNKARASASKAIKLLANDKELVSDALLLRATMAESAVARLGDLNQALEFNPKNLEALRARGLHYLAAKNFEAAAKDFTKALEAGDDNLAVYHALAESLTNLEKYDEALDQLDKALQKSDAAQRDGASSLTHNLRARILVLKGDIPAALTELARSLEKNPGDVAALLMRAQLHIVQKDEKAALKDVEKALTIEPGLVRGLELRASLMAAAGEFDKSIKDFEKLVNSNPQRIDWKLRLGALFVADERPRAAVNVYSGVIAADAGNWMALRGRADAELSIGEHAKAIHDFEAALELQPENSGILNNLAWVLATSPQDELRDAKRSIELAKKACELTEYKQAHILSTLAAGFAEAGDWEAAVKWSTKAVEAGKDTDVKEQLQEELASYEKKKPWRELQQVKEKDAPAAKEKVDLEL